MQVSAQNSLTWLQTASPEGIAASQESSAYGQISPGDDASGADSASSVISALQSPSQMFAPASLGGLISAQSDPAADPGATATATGAAGASAAPHGHHHHHRSIGGPDAAAPSAAASTTGADAGAATDLSQMLAQL